MHVVPNEDNQHIGIVNVIFITPHTDVKRAVKSLFLFMFMDEVGVDRKIALVGQTQTT